MAPSNSTKKLAKVATSGKKRSIRESSDRTYPLAIAGIVVVGCLMLFWSRSMKTSAQEVAPTLQDHWHVAYGSYLCDSFAANPTDQAGDPLGIHTHDDGVVHIHPFSSAAAGEKATIGKFFEDIGVEVTGSKLVTADGTTYESGVTTCPSGEVGVLALVTWNNANDDAEPPEVVRADIADTRFVNDRMAMTLAFVPESKIGEIPRPESIPALDQLTDVSPTAASTTLPADTGTTVAGDTATTTAEGTGTTVAGGTASTLSGEPSTTVAGSPGSTAAGGAPGTTAVGSTTTAG